MSNKDNTPMSVEKQKLLHQILSLFKQHIELTSHDDDLFVIFCLLADANGMAAIRDTAMQRKAALDDFDAAAAAAWAKGEADEPTN